MLSKKQSSSAKSKLQCNHWDGLKLLAKLLLIILKTLVQRDWFNMTALMEEPVLKKDLGNTVMWLVAMVRIWVFTVMMLKKLWYNLSLMMEFLTEVTEKISLILNSMLWVAIPEITRISIKWHASIMQELLLLAESQIQLKDKWMNSSKKMSYLICQTRWEAGNKILRYKFKVT